MCEVEIICGKSITVTFSSSSTSRLNSLKSQWTRPCSAILTIRFISLSKTAAGWRRAWIELSWYLCGGKGGPPSWGERKQLAEPARPSLPADGYPLASFITTQCRLTSSGSGAGKPCEKSAFMKAYSLSAESRER